MGWFTDPDSAAEWIAVMSAVVSAAAITLSLIAVAFWTVRGSR